MSQSQYPCLYLPPRPSRVQAAVIATLEALPSAVALALLGANIAIWALIVERIIRP